MNMFTPSGRVSAKFFIIVKGVYLWLESGLPLGGSVYRRNGRGWSIAMINLRTRLVAMFSRKIW